MKKQSLRSVQMEKSIEQLRREIAWLKRHIKIRESVLAVKERGAK